MELKKIYFNLTKRLFSIQDHKTGLVGGNHKDDFWVSFHGFHIYENGRLRTLAEKKKYVHAYILGYEVDEPSETLREIGKVTYNPYKKDCFMLTMASGNRYELRDKWDYLDFDYVHLTTKEVYSEKEGKTVQVPEITAYAISKKKLEIA